MPKSKSDPTGYSNWIPQKTLPTNAMLQRGKSADTSWFLTNAKGTAIWRRPFSATVGADFRYRDYFHGRNIEYEKGSAPTDLQPLQRPHISLPFISRVTKRYMVALSVPLRNDGGEVIGVLARTLHLDTLQRQLGQDLRDETDTGHLIALADRRANYQLLDHEWLSENADAFTDEVEAQRIFKKLHLSDETVEQIEGSLSNRSTSSNGRPISRDIRISRYEDPVGRLEKPTATPYADDWIAAIAPMKSEKNALARHCSTKASRRRGTGPQKCKVA